MLYTKLVGVLVLLLMLLGFTWYARPRPTPILAEQYPYIGLPTTFLIDKDWRIAKKFVGTIPDREGEKEGELEREIQKLLQAS